MPKHWVGEHPYAGLINLKANQDQVYTFIYVFFYQSRYVDKEKLREINGKQILGMIYDHPFFKKK